MTQLKGLSLDFGYSSLNPCFQKVCTKINFKVTLQGITSRYYRDEKECVHYKDDGLELPRSVDCFG